MKRLLKITAKLGSANTITFIGSLIKNKIIAIFLGTAGMGIVSQLSGFLNLLTNLGTIGMQQGVTKFSAACMIGSEKKVDSKSILSVALFLVGIITLVILFLVVLFNKKISSLIFSDDSYGFGIVVVALSLPFIAFTTIFSYYFKGVGKINLLFKSSILSSFIGLLASLFLIWAFSIKGVILQIFTTGLISFLIFYLFYYFLPENRSKKIRLFYIFNISYVKDIIKELFKHGSVIYVSNFLLPLSLLIIRSLIIKDFGIEQNGVFQSIMIVSAIFISFPFM